MANMHTPPGVDYGANLNGTSIHGSCAHDPCGGDVTGYVSRDGNFTGYRHASGNDYAGGLHTPLADPASVRAEPYSGPADTATYPWDGTS